MNPFFIRVVLLCSVGLFPLSSLAKKPAKVTTVVLVRHAEKKKSRTRNPALTKAGQRRALALRRVLRSMPLHAIYSTPFLRTVQTAEPTAKARKQKITTLLRLKKQVHRLKTKHAGQTVLVVGHSNTVPMMLKMMGVKKSVKIKHSEYDNLFVVFWHPKRATTWLHLRYGAP